MKNKINIDERYFPNQEIRHNIAPYLDYYSCLDKTFDLSMIRSFSDAGCANGPLIYLIKKENPHIDVAGIEYFQWQKDAANDLIKDYITVHDLRDPLQMDRKFDIVNCTETGEHIDPDFSENFIENLKKICGKYLIISWSDSGGSNDRANDENEQHLNPLKSDQVDQLLINHGFTKNYEMTNNFIGHSLKMENFCFWWRKSLGIWEIN